MSGVSPASRFALAAFDWGALGVARALRGAIGVSLPLVVGWMTGHVDYGAYTALGALPAGFASFEGETRTRVAGVLVASIGMAVSTFVGATLAAGAPGLLPLVVAIWAYATGLSVCLGSLASVAVLQWAVALLIAVGMPFDPAEAAMRSGFVLIGGLLQATLVVVSWTVRPGSRERSTLAATFDALALQASALSKGSPPALAPRAIPVDAVLADPNPLLASAQRALMLALLEEADRVRAALAALGADASRASDTRRVLHDAAIALEFVRWALLACSSERVVFVAMLDARVAAWKIPATAPWRWSAEALAGRLRAIARMLQGLDAPQRDARRLRAALSGAWVPGVFSTIGSRVRAHLSPSTEAGRHALRLAAVAAFAEALAQVMGLTQGRWVTLTVLIVLKPDYGATVGRGLHRALGTLLGACLAAAIAFGTRSSPGSLVVACACAVTLAYAVFKVNYFLYAIPLTAFILLLLALMGSPALGSAEARILDTFVGSVLGIAAYVVWPTWKGATAQQEFATLLEAHRDYATALLRAFARPGSVEPPRLRALEVAARKSRSDAQAAASRLAIERARAPFTSEFAQRLLLAVTRLASAELALHALVLSDDRAAPGIADAHVDGLGMALATALSDMAAALRRLEAPQATVPLRPLHAGLAAAAESSSRAFVTVADRLVDATDTTYDLLHSRLARPMS